MCHDILKEEDDEVESLDEATGDDDVAQPIDDLLDEQNGNISAKLTQLTLNDTANDDSVAGLNGNSMENDNADRLNATKTKKKTKKGTNSINNAVKLGGAANDCDSNDNKLVGEGDTALETGDEHLAQQPSVPIKDDVVDVHA